MMDVVVVPGELGNGVTGGEAPEDNLSDSGSTVVIHSDNPDTPAGDKEKKSRKKKGRKGKERKERVSKTEVIKGLEEENAQLKAELNDLNLRLVHLEARDHNKELKLIHLQKELEETRSLLIEKEGDCVEWEQIDREKDRTVLSLNQTIAILQRDLAVLLEEKDSSEGGASPKIRRVKKKPPKPKNPQRICFSPKPNDVFEYPREEDFDSDEDEEYDSEDYDDEEDEEEDESIADRAGRIVAVENDMILKLASVSAPVISSLLTTPATPTPTQPLETPASGPTDPTTPTNGPTASANPEKATREEVFVPFPLLGQIPATGPPSPLNITNNPLVKLFSPSISPEPSPLLSLAHKPPPDLADALNLSSKSSPPQEHAPHSKQNGSHAKSPENGTLAKPTVSIPGKTESNPAPDSPATFTSPPTSPREGGMPSVKELRSMWEKPKSKNHPARVASPK